MMLKLIQSGGFIGRAKFAQEELSVYPKVLEDTVTALFDAFRNPEASEQETGQPDQLLYFLEYDNNRIPINRVTLSPELQLIIDRLKKQLHY